MNGKEGQPIQPAQSGELKKSRIQYAAEKFRAAAIKMAETASTLLIASQRNRIVTGRTTTKSSLDVAASSLGKSATYLNPGEAVSSDASRRRWPSTSDEWKHLAAEIKAETTSVDDKKLLAILKNSSPDDEELQALIQQQNHNSRQPE